jgi:hypothetical protein
VKNASKSIIGIIFSYDRAMQLDAVLKSFYTHCIDHEIVKLTVLYKASDEINASQYQELTSEYPKVKFILQTNFRSDVLKWACSSSSRNDVHLYQRFTNIFLRTRKNRFLHILFNQYVRQALLNLFPYEPDRYLLFLVDDNIFVKDFSIENIINSLNDQSKALGFSLRLGKNTTYCYAHSSDQAVPSFFHLSNHVFFFDWTISEHDFNYPLEISSSVYRTKQIIPLLLRLFFENPNSLEGVIASFNRNFSKRYPFLLCFEQSVTFCNPINIVQKVAPNRVGANENYTAELLSQNFHSGKRVDISKYDGFIPTGCHQEVELFFKNKGE